VGPLKVRQGQVWFFKKINQRRLSLKKRVRILRADASRDLKNVCLSFFKTKSPLINFFKKPNTILLIPLSSALAPAGELRSPYAGLAGAFPAAQGSELSGSFF
jgi:hypothetical protein